jgi:hypothetical protein
MKREQTRIRLGHPHRTPAAGAVKRSSTEKHWLEEEGAQVEAAPSTYPRELTPGLGERHETARSGWGQGCKGSRYGEQQAQHHGAKAILAPQTERVLRPSAHDGLEVTRGAIGAVDGGWMTRHCGSPGLPQVTSAGFTRLVSQEASLMVACDDALVRGGMEPARQIGAHARSRPGQADRLADEDSRRKPTIELCCTFKP